MALTVTQTCSRLEAFSSAEYSKLSDFQANNEHQIGQRCLLGNGECDKLCYSSCPQAATNFAVLICRPFA
jgi:hypothetical protein